MDAADTAQFPSVGTSFLGLLLVLCASQSQVFSPQQFLLYARYQHSLSSADSSPLFTVFLALSVVGELTGFALSPLMLYAVAEAGVMIAVSQYRKVIESRTGSCLEGSATFLCASSIAYPSI